ncbi:hypothetical protein HMN09_00025800 [Mycena chlorophos]|uniref:Methyltransferase domain-containing protein n=1 Tax=Mycena chlorophos TaxID=658473 RepID=A0A8H6TSW0_MYCCL|nr:hypothetical protein HMN09_00025800 [Mycena chlorophos]
MAPVAIDHTPREYQQYPGAQYVLPTDEAEKQRLELQHRAVKQVFNGRILFAPVKLIEGHKVLDTGTGPGIWLLDAANSVNPAVQMTGVDIESRLFPSSPPKNVSFQIGSVLELPKEWSNTFTLVHQRLLIAALQIPQWPQALGEVYRVVRPGGWVQITETTAWIPGAYPGRPNLEKVSRLWGALAAQRNLHAECARDMPRLLANAGFVDIRQESREIRVGKWAGENGVAMKKNYLQVLQGMKTPILQAGGFGIVSSEAEFEALVEGLGHEWEVPRVEKDFEFFVYWAQKPDLVERSRL